MFCMCNTINIVIILQEDILQLAAAQSSDQLLKKSKKHKKHKKTKKPAITLDEFLNMNKDVFGEGIDFEGVEEVPTRAITKRLKVNKKTQISGLKTIPELDKLRKQGIIIKKKSGDGIITKPLKIAQNVIVDKAKRNTKEHTKLSSSNEILSKLISQGNNEIQILKKGSQDNVNVCEVIFKEGNEDIPATVYENENMECDSTKKELGESAMESIMPKEIEENLPKSYNASMNNLDISEKNASQYSQDNPEFKSGCPSPLINSIKDARLSDIIDEHDFSEHKIVENHSHTQFSTTPLNQQKLTKTTNSKMDLAKTPHNTVQISTND